MQITRLFQGEPSVVLWIDNHILFLIRYSVQGYLLSLIVGSQHTVEGHDCHIFANVFRWHGVLIPGIGDEAVFLYPAQVDSIDDVLPAQRV